MLTLPTKPTALASKHKESNKRTRTSPNINEKVSKKTKQVDTYWLSKPHNLDANRFQLLSSDSDSDSDDDDVADSDKTKLQEHPVMQKPKSPPSPPPIFVQNVECIGILQHALANLSPLKYELKILSNNQVKILSENSNHYHQIIAFLKSKDTEFFTYKPKELKGFRVILRNIHYSTDVGDIKEELFQRGHEVQYIHNIVNSRTKTPTSLFSLELKTKSNNNEIFSITDLLHCKIKFEKPLKTQSLPQCTNCQKYGHTKNFCTLKPVCVKCAGNHSTSQCSQQHLNRTQIKCALCGANHTANYKGCTIYKSLKEKIKISTAKSKNVPKQNASNSQQKESYAEILSKNNSATNLDQESTQSSDMSELKTMMKQLLSQISNMMSIITLLLNKLDGNPNTK